MDRFAINQSSSSERGMILVVTLFILLIMTALALSAGDTAYFEHKMSDSQLNRNTSFQAAETAIRLGEQYVEGLAALDAGTANCDASASPCVSTMESVNGGVFTPATSAPWGTNSAYAVPSSDYLTGTAEAVSSPEYVVEYVTNLPDTNSSLGIGTGNNIPGSDFYRITGMGTGRTVTSKSVVQSVYARRF